MQFHSICFISLGAHSVIDVEQIEKKVVFFSFLDGSTFSIIGRIFQTLRNFFHFTSLKELWPCDHFSVISTSVCICNYTLQVYAYLDITLHCIYPKAPVVLHYSWIHLITSIFALKLIIEENGRNAFEVQMFSEISAVSPPLSSFASNSISSSFIPFSLSFLLCNKSLE